MPLSNPFSPSQIRRRLSREAPSSSGRSSPERLPSPRRRYGAIKERTCHKERAREEGPRPWPLPDGGGRAPARDNGNVERRHGGAESTSTTRKAQHRQNHTARNITVERSPPRRRPAGNPSPVVSPALPYSKDFGSFDLTLCEADDGRCVVLVEYEDRVFLNGKQIYITRNGTVSDRDGNPNKVFQHYYDSVLQEKRRLRAEQCTPPPAASKNAQHHHTRGSNLLHESNHVSRGIFKDNSNTMPTSIPNRSSRAKNAATRDQERDHFLKDLGDLEASCSRILGRLCQAILTYCSRREGADGARDNEDEQTEEISRHVQATLNRLIDQFRSLIDLNTSLQDGDTDLESDVDDEEIIEKWMAEAFEDNGETKSNKSAGQEEHDAIHRDAGLIDKAKPEMLSVGTQIKQTPVEKRDKKEQTDRRPEDDKVVIELREENLLLRNEIVALDEDMREMQALQLDLEKRLEEESAKKQAVIQQLADMEDRQEGQSEGVSRIEELTRTQIITASNCQEVRSTTSSIATSTVSSVSLGNLSDVSSSDTEPLSVVGTTDTGVCMRQKSRALKSEIGRLRDVYSDVEDHLSKLAEDNTELRLRVARFNREFKEMNNQLEQANQTREEYKMEIKNLDKVNTELEAKLAETSKERKFESEKLRSVNNELARIDIERKRAERELSDLQKRFDTLTGEKQILSKEFARLEKAHLETSANAAKLSKKYGESEVQLGILRAQIGNMTVENDQLRSENQTNSDARQRAESDNRKIESELRATRKANGELSAEVLLAKTRIGALEDTVRHLESENANLTQQVVHLEGSKVALTKRVTETEASNQRLTMSTQNLAAESLRLKKENLDLRTTVEEMSMLNTAIRSRLDNWGKDSADIGKRMKQIVGVKAELQDFIKQLTSVNSNIEKRFERMDSEYADLERKLQTVGKDEDGEENDGDASPESTEGNTSIQLQEID